MKIFMFAVLLILIYYMIRKAYRNTKDIVINKVKINHTLSNQHQAKLTILQLSDLHLEHISISAEELFEKLKDEPIDIIALTGDFLDRKWAIPRLAPYLKALDNLNAKYGMYAVLGNHDYVLRKNNLAALISMLKEHNCRVLQNENDSIFIEGTLVNIIGIDDFKTKRSNLEASYMGIKPGKNLVLTHDPNIVLHMKKYHFDYLLAGHFHGGQICYPKAYHLIKMGKLARMKVIKGLQMQDGKPFYISEGLGQTGVNIRVGSRPEVTIHELILSNTKRKAVKAG